VAWRQKVETKDRKKMPPRHRGETARTVKITQRR
jgi:hypothetical protein